jgi:hypothetical protein
MKQRTEITMRATSFVSRLSTAKDLLTVALAYLWHGKVTMVFQADQIRINGEAQS